MASFSMIFLLHKMGREGWDRMQFPLMKYSSEVSRIFSIKEDIYISCALSRLHPHPVWSEPVMCILSLADTSCVIFIVGDQFYPEYFIATTYLSISAYRLLISLLGALLLLVKVHKCLQHAQIFKRHTCLYIKASSFKLQVDKRKHC